MKITEFKDGLKRRILIGLITSDAVCGRLASRWDDDMFPDRAANVIGKLCVDHFNRYRRAPGKDFESLVRSWAEGREGDDVGEVDDFLQSLDLDRLDKNLNADLLIDDAGKYFSRVRLDKLFDTGKGHVSRGELDKAQALLDTYKPLEIGAGSFINPLTDDEALRRVHAEKRESIIQYPGGLGEFFGHSLEREALMAILGSEKSGKSHFLLDLAATAVEQGRKVAMFECGDLTERQLMRRLLTRICGRPLALPKGHAKMRYSTPKSIHVDGSECHVKYDPWEITNDLSEKKIKKYRDEWADKHNARENWRLSVHSTSSLSVPMIRSILSGWEKDEFTPDIVIIDYSDILMPAGKGAGDTRDQINTTWKLLSKMRQDLRCLVITATQANAESYEADLLNRRNFSEDKRKHAHVTGMFALNRNDRERKAGIYRLNWLDRRDEAYSEREVCFVAGSLEIGRPMMVSSFRGIES